jgi:hypothetical protein
LLHSFWFDAHCEHVPLTQFPPAVEPTQSVSLRHSTQAVPAALQYGSVPSQHTEPHALSFAQHLFAVVLVHVWSAVQHDVPHALSFAQHVLAVALVHVWSLVQHEDPHTVCPLAHWTHWPPTQLGNDVPHLFVHDPQ